MANKSIKDSILLMIKKEKKMTIAELLEGFSITDIALRRHIHNLERDGFIKSTIVKQALGRPYYIYELTEKGEEVFPSAYQGFSIDILSELEVIKGKEFVYELLKLRMDKEQEVYFKALADIEDFDQKIQKIVEIQEKKGYLTELQKMDDGSYLLQQFNCPLYSVANHYSGLCGQEESLLREVLDDSKVKATSCITEGAKCCTFKIEQNQVK
ncbi:helix-turn-helix transcriptional regulator [Aquibacillus kalidii]|uniref:helix-turn-helix transcriptional regulator n=1 Tax=Aquibacillus kalidii TaxID=2762597 RepID=UPI001645BA0E|nr:DeoR family transcriptional regulator [Aquibacillus kalidii]